MNCKYNVPIKGIDSIKCFDDFGLLAPNSIVPYNN